MAPPTGLPDAFFIPEDGPGAAEGERFRPTELVRGPWSPELAHGGPPAALLARAIERLAGPDFQLARLAVEFVRPIPIATLAVAAHAIRAGRKVQVLGAGLAAAAFGKELARATAVCVRRARVALPPGHPRPREGFAPAPPARCPAWEFPFFLNPVGYHRGIEGRLALGTFGRGHMALWMRPRVPLVRGEAASPVQRTAIVADSGNGVGVALDPTRFTFVNPDLTIALHRPPVGEWICLDAATYAEADGGLGLADTVLFDERGPFGRGLQTLIVEERT